MSSLFGNAGSTPNKTSTLFGAPSNAQQTTSAQSLFGGLNTQAPAATTPSLFGFQGASTTQQQGGGLFGQPQPQQQQQQQQNGSSLFGTNTQSQQQPASSLFGGSTQQPAAPTSNGGLFGNTSTQTPQQNTNSSNQNTGNFNQSQQSSGAAAPAYFDSLLEKGRKRARGDDSDMPLGALPKLSLGLGDISQRVRQLGAAGNPAGRGRQADSKAHYLLTASGVDRSTTARDLSFFDGVRPERAQRPAAFDDDIDGYLEGLETQTTLSMISDGLARSVRDFDAFLEDNVTMEWDAQRKRIYEHFGIKPRDGQGSTAGYTAFAALDSPAEGAFGGRSTRHASKATTLAGSRSGAVSRSSVFGRSSMQRSVIGAPATSGASQPIMFSDVEKAVEAARNNGARSDERFMRETQGKYANCVQSLNSARLQKKAYPILHQFSNVEAQTGDQHAQHMVNAYSALIDMVGEQGDVDAYSSPEVPRERQFLDGYLDENSNSPKSLAIRKRILSGALRHLEKRFFTELEAYVNKNPKEANLGGVPNVLSKVKAYVRLKAAKRDLIPDDIDLQQIGDDYVWAIVFTLLKSGHVKEAADYVTNNNVAFRTIDRNFVTYITDYKNSPDRRLRRELQERINNEYNQRVRIAPERSVDPYRLACYKIIGRCEVSNNREFEILTSSPEQFLWLQFNLAREMNRAEEAASQVFNLDSVRRSLIDIGERVFDVKSPQVANGGFGMYFYMLTLCGLFEKAISYLYTFHHVDAIHFAIALDFYGLLRVSDAQATDGNLLTYNTRELPQIKFGPMVALYTRDFRAANVVAAVDYFTLMCLNADLPGETGKQQAALCHEALRELVLESREFAQLLGDIRSDGRRIKGSIEERLSLLALDDTSDFMRAVTTQAASVADDNGRTTDAVLLYHLADEHNKVLSIVVRAAGEAVAIPIGQEQMRLQPLKPREDLRNQQAQPGSSLSLTSVDDPIELSASIHGLYSANTTMYKDIDRQKLLACKILVQMNQAKQRVEAGQWTAALDVSNHLDLNSHTKHLAYADTNQTINELNILPMGAEGSVSKIRASAAAFDNLDQSLARNVPNLLQWAIVCCGRQRDVLAHGQFGGNEGTRRQMVEQLAQSAKDLMMYAGMLKYKMPVGPTQLHIIHINGNTDVVIGEYL